MIITKAARKGRNYYFFFLERSKASLRWVKILA